MRIFIFFLGFLFLGPLSVLPIFGKTSSIQASVVNAYPSYIQVLASLSYHLKTQVREFDTSNQNTIIFDESDIKTLWNKAFAFFYHLPCPQERHTQERILHQAYADYISALTISNENHRDQAQFLFKQVWRSVTSLWEEAIDEETVFSIPKKPYTQLLRAHGWSVFTKNSRISAKAKRKIQPYLIPLQHEMKPALDAIFKAKHATASPEAFAAAGFITISQRPRSYVYVAKHQNLPGYLVKAYMDTEKRKKRNLPSWEWLVKRCVGAEKIRNIIEKKAIKHFVVARKWIYPLPAALNSSSESGFDRHIALLLVTDMKLASDKDNYYAWLHHMSRAHLSELYYIISHAKGSSYRPDNIALVKSPANTSSTQNDKFIFAFIDTEYPSLGPDYASPRNYLNPEMQKYWDWLIKNGGD